MAVNKKIDSEELGKIVQSVFPTQIEPGSLADRLLMEGEERGIEKGMEQGMEKGMEQGMEQGKEAVIGMIHMFEELLADTLTPEPQLKSQSLVSLTTVAQGLQQRLRDRTR